MSRSKPILGPGRAWLAVLSLVPWMVLAATGGGLHNHRLAGPALAATPASAASDVGSLGEAPGIRGNDIAPRDAPCAACLWQAHSGAAFPASPSEPAALPAAPWVLARQIPRRAAPACGFAPRAPPPS